MTDNFLDNVNYGASTLSVSGNAVQVGDGQVGAKSVIFSNNGGAIHLAANPSGNATINLPINAGTILLSSQAILSISAGGNAITSGQIIFSNSNNVSFGINGQTITASITSQTVQTQNIVVPSAGTQTAISGTAVFSNSNNITFGMSSSSQITASYNFNFSAGTTSNNVNAITFSNSNGMSFGLNGSTITGSYTVPTQSNQSVGLYALGNTIQNSSTTLDARTLSFNGLGGATVGYSNGSIQISVPTTVGLLSAINLSAGTTSNNLSAFTFANGNGISFGLNASTITASYTVPTQSNQTDGMYAIGNTTGQSSSSTFDARTLSVSGAGIVSVGYSGNALVISASSPQTNQTVGLYALGNTTQNSSTTLDARTLSFNGLGAATIGYSNGSIQVSVPVQTVQTQSNIAGVFDGANSISTGTIRFTNANGVSFSINGQTISGSVAAQTNQTVGLYALGNTTQNSSTTLDARTLSFNGLGIITAGYSNGSIQLSATQSAQTQNIVVPSAGTQTATSGTLVWSNSNNITFGMSGSSRVTASYNFNLSAGTTSNNLNSVTFADGNGIAFGLNAGTITASYTVPTQTNQTIGGYAVGNTTGQSSSSTIDARSLSFNGAGIASVGYSGGSVIISVPAGGGAGDGVNIIAAGTQTANTTGTVVFSNSNNVSFGMTNNSIVTASVSFNQTADSAGFYAVGNTTQNSSTTLDIRTLSFNGLGGATVGYSNGSIQISAQSGPGYAVDFFEPIPLLNALTTTTLPGQASLYFQSFIMPGNFISGRINNIEAMSAPMSIVSSARQPRR